jgi:hypothetical protein
LNGKVSYLCEWNTKSKERGRREKREKRKEKRQKWKRRKGKAIEEDRRE